MFIPFFIGPFQMVIILVVLVAIAVVVVIVTRGKKIGVSCTSGVAATAPPVNAGPETVEQKRQRDIAVAFALMLIGTLVQSLPDTGAYIRIASLLSNVFIFIGFIKLLRNTGEAGRAGVIILMLAGIANIVAGFLNMEMTPLFDLGFGGSSGPDETLIRALSRAIITANLLYLVGYACWLNYKPFANMRPAITLLLGLAVVALLSNFEIILWDDLRDNAFRLLRVIGLFGLVFTVFPRGRRRKAVNAILLSAVGMILSLAVMIDDGLLSIGVGFLGVFVWLVSVLMLRKVDRKGTLMFLVYALLMIVYLIIALIPAIGEIAFVVLIPALLVFAVSMFFFRSSGIFAGQPANGTILLAVVTFLCLTGLIPGAGKWLYCLAFLPLIMLGWIRAVNACIKAMRADDEPAVSASRLGAMITVAIAIAVCLFIAIGTAGSSVPTSGIGRNKILGDLPALYADYYLAEEAMKKADREMSPKMYNNFVEKISAELEAIQKTAEINIVSSEAFKKLDVEIVGFYFETYMNGNNPDKSGVQLFITVKAKRNFVIDRHNVSQYNRLYVNFLAKDGSVLATGEDYLVYTNYLPNRVSKDQSSQRLIEMEIKEHPHCWAEFDHIQVYNESERNIYYPKETCQDLQ